MHCELPGLSLGLMVRRFLLIRVEFVLIRRRRGFGPGRPSLSASSMSSIVNETLQVQAYSIRSAVSSPFSFRPDIIRLSSRLFVSAASSAACLS